MIPVKTVAPAWMTSMATPVLVLKLTLERNVV